MGQVLGLSLYIPYVIILVLIVHVHCICALIFQSVVMTRWARSTHQECIVFTYIVVTDCSTVQIYAVNF